MSNKPQTPNTNPQTILVTGGCGFIGSHIVDAYVEAGYKVAVVDDLSTGKEEFLNAKAKFYKVDLRDTKAVAEMIAEFKPEIINHHAAQKSVTHSVADPVHDAGINIIGFLNLLEAGRQHGLKKVIFASTGGAIYGDAEVIPTPENYDAKPISPYGISKLASEHYLRYYHAIYGIETVILRYGNVYGPRQDPYGEAGVVAIFAKKILAQTEPTIFGDGINRRDYVYVGDVVSANLLAVDAKNGIYNIGTATETDVNEIFTTLVVSLKQMKIDNKITKPVHASARAGEQRRSCLDVTRAKKSLKWQPKFDLSKGIAETIDYFRKK